MHKKRSQFSDKITREWPKKKNKQAKIARPGLFKPREIEVAVETNERKKRTSDRAQPTNLH